MMAPTLEKCEKLLHYMAVIDKMLIIKPSQVDSAACRKLHRYYKSEPHSAVVFEGPSIMSWTIYD